MRRALTLASLSAALCLARPAAAQDRYQDSNGAAWAIATFEGVLVLSVPLVVGLTLGPRTSSSPDPSPGLIGLGVALGLDLGVALVAASVTGAVAGETGTTAAPPLAIFSGVHAGLGLAALGSGIVGLVDEDVGWVGGLVGGFLGLGLGLGWAAARAERMTYEPALNGPAHGISWIPLGSMALAGTILTVALSGTARAGPITLLVVGLVGTGAVAASVAWTEAAMPSRGASPGPAPLVAPLWATTF